jgi:hypothetical protein
MSGYITVQGPSSKWHEEIEGRLRALQVTPTESETQPTPADTETQNTLAEGERLKGKSHLSRSFRKLRA